MQRSFHSVASDGFEHFLARRLCPLANPRRKYTDRRRDSAVHRGSDKGLLRIATCVLPCSVRPHRRHHNNSASNARPPRPASGSMRDFILALVAIIVIIAWFCSRLSTRRAACYALRTCTLAPRRSAFAFRSCRTRKLSRRGRKSRQDVVRGAASTSSAVKIAALLVTRGAESACLLGRGKRHAQRRQDLLLIACGLWKFRHFGGTVFGS